LSGARRLARPVQILVPRGGGAAVLAYHLIGGGSSSPVDLDAAVFEAHLRWLAASGRVAEPRSWLVDAGHVAAARLVLLTFDDAFENFYRVAYPALCEHGLAALLFVPVGFVEGPCGAPLAGAEALPAMSWDQLREVSASGSIVVGSHSWSHPDLRRLDEQSLRRELVDSRDRLQEKLGAAVRVFCYPRALWSRRVEAVVREVYDFAFVAGGGRVPCGRRFDPLRVPRLPIRRDMPSSLESVLRSRVWLEEWIADKVRRYLR
jgi:peptidoglycan/xylan/chitin deacetylase (PgdA/CDA1 family)